jgi:hypothetical protein
MKTHHTPGPWRIGVRQPNSDKFIYGAYGEEVADCDRLTNFPDENLSNARLIAAAPELLKALKLGLLLIERIEPNDKLDEHEQAFANAARAAIQKATGEQP